MHNYNAETDLRENYENYIEVYDLNIKHINENGGENLTDEEKNILIAGFLGNMHETLSTVSSELCSLSKSTYEAQVYIDEIREKQEEINYCVVKDDINDILNDNDMDDSEKLEMIKEYVNNLVD